MSGFEKLAEVAVKHMDGASPDPKPEAAAAAPVVEGADKAKAPAAETVDKAPLDAGDVPDDDAPADPPADEDEAEETDGAGSDEPEEEDVESILEKVSADDLKRIEADPALQKAYKSMQRGFTQKSMAVAERETAVTALEAELDAIRTPDGMAGYLAEIFESHPTVVGAAFEAVAQGENGDDFLIAIGRAHPERLEKAYERVQEMLADPKELQAYDREAQQNVREQEIERREQATKRQAFDTDFLELGEVLEAEARRLGIPAGEDLRAVKAALVDAVRIDNKTGRIATTRADVRKMVADKKAELDRIESRVKKQLDSKRALTSQAETKQRAEKAKEPAPAPPRGVVVRRPPVEVEGFTPPEDPNDRLGSFIAHRLGQ